MGIRSMFRLVCALSLAGQLWGGTFGKVVSIGGLSQTTDDKRRSSCTQQDPIQEARLTMRVRAIESSEQSIENGDRRIIEEKSKLKIIESVVIATAPAATQAGIGQYA